MNTLLTITGPSLSGKSTLESMLHQKYGLEKIISFTTRKPRQGEVSGEHYYFLDRELAEKKIANGEMAEYVEFSGNLYGILGSELQYKLSKNSCIAVVEPRGLVQMKAYCRDHGIRHRSVFLTNSPEALACRFLRRFRDNPEAKVIDYAPRLVTMIRDEQAWLHVEDYDKVVLHFDSTNEQYVVERVYQDLIEKE